MTWPRRTRSARFEMLPPITRPSAIGQNRMSPSRASEVDEHPRDGDRGEDDDRRGRAREEPERDAGVLDVPDPERPEDVDTVAEREVRGDDPSSSAGRRRRPRPRSRRATATAPRVAANDRVARETGVSASVDEPTRTSSLRAGSLILPSSRARSRCRATPTDAPPAARPAISLAAVRARPVRAGVDPLPARASISPSTACGVLTERVVDLAAERDRRPSRRGRRCRGCR